MAARHGRKGVWGTIGFVVNAVLWLVTVVTVILLLAAYLAPYVDPNWIVWFAFVGLIAPFLYVLDGLLTLYWILRWKPVAVVTAAVLAVGAGNVTKYFRPELRKDYRQPAAEGLLKVLSYNVGGFLGDRDGKQVNQMDEVAAYIREVDPDIVCLQEFEANRLHPLRRFDEALGAWKYKVSSYVYQGDSTDNGWGLAIYSKYPIAGKRRIRFPESSNSAMWADIVVRRDTIRVFNNHLQTTQIDRTDKEFIESEVLADSSRREKTKNIYRKLRRNFEKRALQADSLAGFIHDGTPNVIVCGDFNDTPMSYTYRTMRGDLVDAFQRKGRGMAVTYKGLFGIFRIDYIFHSRSFETLSYEAARPQWSDHNPVIVELKLRR